MNKQKLIRIMEKIKAFCQKNRRVLLIAGAVLLWLIMVLIGIFTCKVPPVTAVLVALLEVGMAGSLFHTRIWLHAVALLFNVLLAILASYTGYMLLMCLVYAAAIGLAYELFGSADFFSRKGSTEK